MRNSFTLYSKYYDSLYKNKNYLKEVNHYLKISKKYKSKKIKNIVDIGCGTGVHSFLLAKKSYNLLGIDKSQNMLNIAISKKKKLSKKLKINFKKLDILKQEINFKKKFDAIFLFFHVFSYFLNNKDINFFFKQCHKNLSNNGLIILDFWNKDSVEKLKLNNTFKKFQLKKNIFFREIKLLRKNKSIVEMRLSILNYKKKILFNEVHKMRYFSKFEIENYAKKYFKVVASYEYLKLKKISNSNWTGVLVLEKK